MNIEQEIPHFKAKVTALKKRYGLAPRQSEIVVMRASKWDMKRICDFYAYPNEKTIRYHQKAALTNLPHREFFILAIEAAEYLAIEFDQKYLKVS